MWDMVRRQAAGLKQELKETETEKTEPHCEDVALLPAVFPGADIRGK